MNFLILPLLSKASHPRIKKSEREGKRERASRRRIDEERD